MISSDALRPTPNQGRKALGKLATRLEEVKNPWRQGSTLELSHNEAARLATDALLESGEKEYRRVLTEERELNFLSSLEIRYITENAAKSSTADNNSSNGVDRDYGEGDTVSELTSGTYFPMMSDEEPPVLELGWPESPHRYGPSETQIYFQREKTQNVKDLVRSLINKAKKVIALVMDIFTDVDLLCDLMEASNKRKVPVYILLDEKNLNYFTDMCDALDIQSSHLGNMRVRSVCGDTYCTKSGKKFTGQVQEKFMIIDCEEVIAGSYSFTWLSAQVNSNMLLHFSGRITDSFDREFRCLYADSQIVNRFHNADEEGLPYYPYTMVAPSMGTDLDFMMDRGNREHVSSENSSSQSRSSSSLSSIKAAPNAAAAVYKVALDKKDPGASLLKGPERRGSPNPGPQMPQGGHAARGSPNGTRQSPTAERSSTGGGQTAAPEWAKAGTPEFLRANLGGPTSKFQALGLGLYNHKNFFQNAAKTPPPPRHRTPSNPLLSRLSDMFTSPGKEKDSYIFRRSPPHSTVFGGPDLSQTEPENKQPLPAPGPMPVPMPAAAPVPAAAATDGLATERWLSRRDEKRMTLGHSKLDLVNHYNKLKSKQIYSRFELKNNN